MNNSNNKIKNSFKLPGIIASILIGIYCITLLLPIIWGFLMSIKTPGDYLTNRVAIPAFGDWQFINYVKAFTNLSSKGNNLFQMFFNSIWYSIGATTIGLFANILVGYVLAVYKNKFTTIVYYLSLFVMLFPIVSNLSGQLKMSRFLGWYNSPLTLVSNLGCIGFSVLIYKSIFSGIDKSYYEAAYVDGAGHFTIAFKIMIPQAIAPAFAMWITTFITLWNDAENVLLFLPDYPTVMSGLYLFEQEGIRDLDYPPLYAGLLIASVPLVALFSIFNKKIMEINIGGVLK